MTEEEKQNFMDKIRNFPKETDRKANLYRILNEILENIGSFLNDSKAKLELKEVNGKESLVYHSVYGTFVQSVQDDDAAAFFSDAMKLFFAHVKELQ